MENSQREKQYSHGIGEGRGDLKLKLQEMPGGAILPPPPLLFPCSPGGCKSGDGENSVILQLPAIWLLTLKQAPSCLIFSNEKQET